MRTYDDMGTAEKIRNLRKRTGLSQDEVAEKLEVSQALVSAWERGTNVPRLPELMRLAAVVGATADYLLNERDERTVESLGVELRVREFAGKYGWEAVYDRLMGAPAHAGARSEITSISGPPDVAARESFRKSGA